MPARRSVSSVAATTHENAADRLRGVSRALQLEWLTLGWMVVEAVVALTAGVAAHSLVLEAFGADSVIELLSAGLLIWRLRVELNSGRAFSETIEHRASRVGGSLLFALSAYVAVGAVYGLWTRQGQDFTKAGLIVSGAAIPVMYFLAKGKLRVADQIGSRALRADAIESVTCGYLSSVVFVALIGQFLFNVWWVPAVSALVLVPFLVREAREAWEGGHCCRG